jgi:hypothetical protein
MEQYGNINARKRVIGGPSCRYTALVIPKHVSLTSLWLR